MADSVTVGRDRRLFPDSWVGKVLILVVAGPAPTQFPETALGSTSDKPTKRYHTPADPFGVGGLVH